MKQDQLRNTGSLEDLYSVLGPMRMTPGWHKKRPSLWKEPRKEFQPLHWRYAEGRLALDQAGQWIGTDLAERRNLLLFNPVGDNDYATVRTLVVAYQMIKPGEHARAHWHTPNAMRLILDAQPGCFTVVDGIKLPMRTGDFLITPGGCWHSHYNEGKHNAYWIDVLDVPLVHLLGPMFWEEHPDWSQKVVGEPAEHPFYFPPARMQSLLDAAAPVDGSRAVTLPTAQAMPTVDIGMKRLAGGTHLVLPLSTASRIFAVVGGSGVARVGELAVDWARGDVFIAPAWHPCEIVAGTDATLFEVNDEPVMKKLGLLRTR